MWDNNTKCSTYSLFMVKCTKYEPRFIFMNIYINSDLEIRKMGTNIQIARKRRKLSLAELALKSAISKTVLLRIENGDPTVGIGKVFNVLDALGLLQGIADIANPELDKKQTLAEIEELRDTTIMGKRTTEKNRLIRF